MKKSAQVQLTLVAAIAMAGCGRPYDPCRAETFDPIVCQQAISDGGYYYGGHWFGMYYGHPYPYYYSSYGYYVSRGGVVRSPSVGSYSHPSGGVARGGFGATARGGGGS